MRSKKTKNPDPWTDEAFTASLSTFNRIVAGQLHVIGNGMRLGPFDGERAAILGWVRAMGIVDFEIQEEGATHG